MGIGVRVVDEQRIYVVIAATVQTAQRNVVQPSGRQIAQACHVVSKLRLRQKFSEAEYLSYKMQMPESEFQPITTIILQARDSAEMGHIYYLLNKKRLNPEIFSDTNAEYGPGEWPTAVAVLATKKQTRGILDYLPMWGPK